MKSIIVCMIGASAVSLPMRGVWIEIATARQYILSQRSLPMRGVWIEIVKRV